MGLLKGPICHSWLVSRRYTWNADSPNTNLRSQCVASHRHSERRIAGLTLRHTVDYAQSDYSRLGGAIPEARPQQLIMNCPAVLHRRQLRARAHQNMMKVKMTSTSATGASEIALRNLQTHR